MADRVTLVKTTPLGAYGSYATINTADMTMAAADTDGKNQFVASGNELVVAFNSDSGAQTLTVNSVADPYGRTGNIATYSIGAGEYAIFGPFRLDGWKQTDGKIYLEASSALVKLGVIALPGTY